MRSLARDLGRLLGADGASTLAPDLAACGRDMWPRALLAPDGRIEIHPPEVVTWPRSTREVVALVRYAARRGVPVVPYGAGSGVCGGAVPVRGGIALDMKRMRAAVAIDRDDHAATFECGILGQHLEDRLARDGLTLGHFPSSIYCSTLGGWLAARSAGQASSRYGKIEDMVLGLEAVDGAGRVIDTDREKAPDLGPLLVGSEGTLAVLTRARLRVWPAPEARRMRGYRFRSVAPGLEAIRRLMQLGLRPAVVRLYDEVDTAMSSLARPRNRHAGPLPARPIAPPPRVLLAALRFPRAVNAWARFAASTLAARAGALLVLGFEGPRARAEAEFALAHALVEAGGGRDLGEGPGVRWLGDRYRVSYKQSPVYAAGAFVDTMEVAATWDRLPALHAAVRAAISRHALVMAHFSHAYPEGCSIYFTFVSSRDARARDRYDRLWSDALGAALDAGGTLSHHHGVGLLKAAFMAREHGEAMDLLRACKRRLDPHGILNPGKLGL